MKRKIIEITASLLVFIIAVCLLYWFNKSISLITTLLGFIFIAYGIALLIQYQSEDDKSIISLLSAIIAIIIGLMLFSRSSLVLSNITFLMGMLVIIMGLESLSRTLDSGGVNYNVNIGLSITSIVIGFLCLLERICFTTIFAETLGILLIIFSVVSTINSVISE